MSDQGFWVDESGNVQRQPKHGAYGFRGWWQQSKDFSGGLPIDYDWRKMDRPTIERGPLKTAKTSRQPKGPQAEEEGRDWGPAQEQDISGFATDPTPSRFKNRRALPQGPGSTFNHTLINVRVTGMTTDPFGEVGDRRGALPAGSQFAGTRIEPQTGLGGGRFPGAIEATATSEPTGPMRSLPPAAGPSSTTNRSTAGLIG